MLYILDTSACYAVNIRDSYWYTCNKHCVIARYNQAAPSVFKSNVSGGDQVFSSGNVGSTTTCFCAESDTPFTGDGCARLALCWPTIPALCVENKYGCWRNWTLTRKILCCSVEKCPKFSRKIIVEFERWLIDIYIASQIYTCYTC